MKPNFLYIGTGKAGSTWLFESLRQHPDVYVTPVKETNFFDLNYQRGVSWYESFFRDARHKAVGEITHRYLHHQQAPQRIHEVLGPDVRLLVCLRRPEDFALSSYQFARRNGRFAGTTDEWMAQRFKPVSICYFDLIEPFLRRFGAQQLHVICFDDLEADPNRVFADVCRFIGVDPMPLPEALRGRVNAAAGARAAPLALSVNRASKFFKRNGQPRLIAWVKRRKLLQKLLYARLSRDSLPKLSEAARLQIRNLAQPQLGALDRALGSDFCARWYSDKPSFASPPPKSQNCHTAGLVSAD